MTAPVDEIDVGRDPHVRPPWSDWSRSRRRAAVALLVVLVAAASAVWFAVHRSQPAPPPPTAATSAVAPGADVLVELPPDTDKCPPKAVCRYDDTIVAGAQEAFAEAFGSAGYIGRQTVTDARTGEVYWQFLRFATGTLVTVTLTQQPVSRAAAPPADDDSPGDGAVTLTVVHAGYLATANAAGLPGQALPLRAVRQWLRTVPAP